MEERKESNEQTKIVELSVCQSPEMICKGLMEGMDMSSLIDMKSYLEGRIHQLQVVSTRVSPKFRVGDVVRVVALTKNDRIVGNAYREGEVFVVRYVTKDSEGNFAYRKLESVYSVSEAQLEHNNQ